MKKILNEIENKRKVICVNGRIGHGKTMAMSTIASELKEEINAELFSNYGLVNSVDANELSLPSSCIVCLDEFEHVLNRDIERACTFFEENKEKNLIVFITSFDSERLPESIREIIDVNLLVEKESDEKIKVTGVNVQFDKVIEIEVGKKYYDAFKIAKAFL
ncbi:hypothetical protein [Bacillus cereus]|uniref:hypothetical protein n=1 Tax=Bacillus cereus TaxID=1396 RepID=UPI003A8ED842